MLVERSFMSEELLLNLKDRFPKTNLDRHSKDFPYHNIDPPLLVVKKAQ
jgi:hypothetical protein